MAIWKIDAAHTNVGFTARHMMVTTVRGSFNKVDFTLNFDPANPAAASVEATIDANSISTNNDQRDGHLRSPDFLDVANFPTITFKSTKVDLSSPTEGKVTGNLTIRGTTRPVVLNVEYLGVQVAPFDKLERAGFSASAKINREDFNLTWNVALEAGGWLVSKDITLVLDVEAVKQTVTEAAKA